MKEPECPICGETPTIHEVIDYEQFCGISMGSEEEHVEELGDEWVITPSDLNSELQGGSKVVLVDVREPHEWDITHITGSTFIPEGDVLARMNELDTADDIVLICRTGIRSARALNQLREVGFTKLRNLVGGLHGWADDVDPSVPKY